MSPERFNDTLVLLRDLRERLRGEMTPEQAYELIGEMRQLVDITIMMFILPAKKGMDYALMEALATLLLSVSRTTGATSSIRTWWVSDYAGFDRSIEMFTRLYGEVKEQVLTS